MAAVLGSDAPDADFDDFAARVAEFEREYGYMRHVRENVRVIVAAAPKFETLFAPTTTVTKFDGTIDQRLFDRIAPHLDWLQRQGLLVFELGESSGIRFGGPATGIFLSFKLAVLDAYYEIASAVVVRSSSQAVC